MTENKTCPKCGGEMGEGKYISGYGAARLVKHGDLRGDKIIPFYCKNCGFIELYQKNEEKEVTKCGKVLRAHWCSECTSEIAHHKYRFGTIYV